MPFPQFARINHRKGSGRLLILSDLHIWGPEDPLYRALLRFLNEQMTDGVSLFIVGDLFDIFIGNKAIFSQKYRELIDLLKLKCRSGANVYYLEGNHDFLLKGVFAGESRIEIFSEEIIFEWDQRLFYFCHGDRINPRDYSYRAFRMAIRNPLSKCLIDICPGTILDSVGRSLSATSRKYNPNANDETIQMFRNYACDKISKGYDFVVMGHSHYLDDIKFKVDSHQGQYVNVGFPRRDCRYLEISPGEPFVSQKCWQEYIAPLKPRLLP